MSPDTVAKVFEPFFTTKPLGQGTGLGLSMIYGFAKQSRGHVRIDSAKWQGHDVQAVSAEVSGTMVDTKSGSPTRDHGHLGAGRDRARSSKTIQQSALIISDLLRDLGYACIEAGDGQAALPMLTSNTPLDLLITDVGLPGLNGRQSRKSRASTDPDLKVLFVTGYAEHATGHAPSWRPAWKW